MMGEVNGTGPVGIAHALDARILGSTHTYAGLKRFLCESAGYILVPLLVVSRVIRAE